MNVGNDNDLQIKHNGSNSFITDTGTGDLYIRAADNLRIQATSTNEDMIKAVKNGGIELYHDNSKTLEVTSSGVNVTGHITASGNISASGQYFGHQILTTNHLADIAETTERFIPHPAYFIDNAANHQTARWIAPFDGELEKILVNSDATPGSTRIKLYAGTDGNTEKDSDTVDMSSADTTYTFNFASASTITAGDLLRVSYQASADSDNVSFTCVWKYNIK